MTNLQLTIRAVHQHRGDGDDGGAGGRVNERKKKVERGWLVRYADGARVGKNGKIV